MIVSPHYQEFAPRELYVPKNPSVGALAAQSSAIFQTNPSPINRNTVTTRRQSRFFGRGRIGNNVKDGMAAPDRGSTKDGTMTKTVRFSRVSFCRATNREISYQDKTTIPKHIFVPSTAEIPSEKSDPSDESPRFSTTASRFRFVSFRRGSNRKNNRRTRSNKTGDRRKKWSLSNKRTSAKPGVDTTKSEAAQIMEGIISGNSTQAENGSETEEQDFTKNAMCHPYKYCYCEKCFDPKWDWEFHESDELDSSGKHNIVWERQDYRPRA